jgi:hypothetical protein
MMMSASKITPVKRSAPPAKKGKPYVADCLYVAIREAIIATAADARAIT